MESKKETKVYKVRCTDGSVKEYTYREIFSLVKDYLEQQGQHSRPADVDKYIPVFIRHFKKVISDDYTREYDEAKAAAKQAEEA